MREIIGKSLKLIIAIILLTSLLNSVSATNININSINVDKAREYLEDVNPESINLEDIDTSSLDAGLVEIITMYEELSREYTNEEIADMFEENATEIKAQTGVDTKTITAGTNLLRSLDTEETRKILEEDLNVEEMKQMLEDGYTPDQIAESVVQKISAPNKIIIFFKLLVANTIFKTILMTMLVITIYLIAVRWIMYKKAGRHGWAAIIPIYNDVTYLKVCKLSPWLLLLLLVPIIGWLILGIIQIISRFKLSKAFGKGVGFGFGLLLLAIIFESIIAFNPNIKYVED